MTMCRQSSETRSPKHPQHPNPQPTWGLGYPNPKPTRVSVLRLCTAVGCGDQDVQTVERNPKPSTTPTPEP
ncbi:hypothetical protein T484DRAFT_1986701 [Baffinella frigidus]|nr:hypothetical protein T484DRAFT_1986701 [Cryptophyta sp. CCMP2293]